MHVFKFHSKIVSGLFCILFPQKCFGVFVVGHLKLFTKQSQILFAYKYVWPSNCCWCANFKTYLVKISKLFVTKQNIKTLFIPIEVTILGQSVCVLSACRLKCVVNLWVCALHLHMALAIVLTESTNMKITTPVRLLLPSFGEFIVSFSFCFVRKQKKKKPYGNESDLNVSCSSICTLYIFASPLS